MKPRWSCKRGALLVGGLLLLPTPMTSFGQSTETKVQVQVEAALRVVQGETSRTVLLFDPLAGENPDPVVSLSRQRLLSENIAEYRPPGIPDTTEVLLRLHGVRPGPEGLEISASLMSMVGQSPRPASTGGRVRYREELHRFVLTCQGNDCSLGDPLSLLHNEGGMSGWCLEDYLALSEEERRRCPGQEYGVGWRRCDADLPGSAVVRGRLVPQSEGVSPERTVRIREVEGPWSCSAGAADEGAFELREVPPGTYLMTVGGSDLRESAPIPLDVGPEGFFVFAIPLFPEDLLARCMTADWCASALTRRTSLEVAGTEEEALQLLGYRLAIVLGGDGMFGADWAVCVEDSEEVLEALREAFPNVAPASECERRETQLEGMYGPREMLRHLPSGRPARSIRVQGLRERTDTEASVGVSWGVGPLWAAGFDCRLERVEGVWIPRSCSRTWVS